MGFNTTFLAKSSFGVSGDNSGWFDAKPYLDRYAVCARGTGGIWIIDLFDPANPVVTDSLPITFGSYGRSKGVTIIGDQAYIAFRRGSSDSDGFGAIAQFDISDVNNIVAGPTWDPNNSAVVEFAPPDTWTYLCSAVAHDGVNLFVAGQRTGYFKLLASDINAGPTAEQFNTQDPETLETQGVYYDSLGDYVVFADYTHGLQILDNATFGGTINHSVPSPDFVSPNLKSWDIVIRGGWAYVCPTVTGDTDRNSPLRGLMTLDLRGDVTLLTASDWNLVSIPPQYNDIWNGRGDSPLNDINILGRYAYISNGQRGVVQYDIKDPAAPVFMGLSAVPDGIDNLYLTKVFDIGGRTILMTGDGFQVPGTGSKNAYFYEVNNMDFTIGNYDPAAVTDQQKLFVTDSINVGPGDTVEYNYTALTGDTITDVWWFSGGNASSRDFKVGLYDRGTGLQVGSDIDIPAWNDGNTPTQYTETLPAPIELTADVEYCIKLAFVNPIAVPNVSFNRSFPNEAGTTAPAAVDNELNPDLTGEAVWNNNNILLAFLGQSAEEGEPPTLGEVMKGISSSGNGMWTFRDLTKTSTTLFADSYWSNAYASSMFSEGDQFLIVASDKSQVFNIDAVSSRTDTVTLSTGLEID